jgi:hypothetical protein
LPLPNQCRRGNATGAKLLIEFGGARGSRTPDLLNAIQALSQLSYGPFKGSGISNR